MGLFSPVYFYENLRQVGTSKGVHFLLLSMTEFRKVSFGCPQGCFVPWQNPMQVLADKAMLCLRSLVSPWFICCWLQLLLTHFISVRCQQVKMPLKRDERGWKPLTPASKLYTTKMLSSFVREIILKDVFCSVDICMWVINSSTGMEWRCKTFPCCHGPSYSLCFHKVINSSLTCDAVCDFFTPIFSVISQGRDPRLFHGPFYELLGGCRHFVAVCSPGVWLLLYFVLLPWEVSSQSNSVPWL